MSHAILISFSGAHILLLWNTFSPNSDEGPYLLQEKDLGLITCATGAIHAPIKIKSETLKTQHWVKRGHAQDLSERERTERVFGITICSTYQVLRNYPMLLLYFGNVFLDNNIPCQGTRNIKKIANRSSNRRRLGGNTLGSANTQSRASATLCLAQVVPKYGYSGPWNFYNPPRVEKKEVLKRYFLKPANSKRKHSSGALNRKKRHHEIRED